MVFTLRNAPTLLSTALIALTLLGAPANAAADRLMAAIHANNITALEALARSAANPLQRSLAAGTVLALRAENAAAIARLKAVVHSPAPGALRAMAYIELASVYIRAGRYGASYSALRAATRLSPHSMNFSDRQTMAFAHALAAVKPMRQARAASGSLRIRWDKAGLPRVPIDIDGQRQYAVLDTGAGFSTISASAAKRAGIRMLSQSVSVGSSTERAVATRLGVAPRLRIGKTLLTNVVFIVMPDSALSFANAAYKIDAIVGLPVFIALRRIEIASSGANSTFVYDAAGGKPADTAALPESNLLLSGLEPLLLVCVPGASGPLRMALDSGANKTIFAHNAIADAPALLAHAERHALTLGGAGGQDRDRRALLLPAVTLIIDGRRFDLRNVPMMSRQSASSDGKIGEDILRQGAWVRLDFRTMRLTIAERERLPTAR
jgi:predicted aspartyl protease